MRNYFTRIPPLAEECYYEEDVYGVKDQSGSFHPHAQFPTWIIEAYLQKINVRTLKITIEKVNMSEMETTIATTTRKRPTMETETIELDHMFLHKKGTLVLQKLEVTCPIM